MIDKRIISVMASIATRQKVREQTLVKLFVHKIIPRVFICTDFPPGRENLLYTQKRIFDFLENEYLKTRKEYCLFCEDDLDIAPNFTRGVEKTLLYGFDAVTFYLNNFSFYPNNIKNIIKTNRAPSEGIYPIVNQKKYFGSQCILFKSRVIFFIKDLWIRYPQIPFDNLWGKISCKLRAFVPNSVQPSGAALKSTWSP